MKIITLIKQIRIKDIAWAILFVVVFFGVVRQARVTVNTQWIYPQVEQLVEKQESPHFTVQLREGNNYFEVLPVVVKTGWKTKYNFRIEGGIMFLFAGFVMLLFGVDLRFFGYLVGSQVAFGVLSYVALLIGVSSFPAMISVSNLIMVYLSPAVCIMLAILSVGERRVELGV